MSPHKNIRWLQPHSEVLRRRRRLGWMLVLSLGAFVCAGVASVSYFDPRQSSDASNQAAASIAAPPEEPDVEQTASAESLGAASDQPHLSRAPAPAETESVPAWHLEDLSTTGSVELLNRQNEVARTAPNAEGWWVILASFPEANPSSEAASKARENAARCDVNLLLERSSQFEGFAPGLHVYLAGPYSDRAKANEHLRKARVCKPDAYVKWAKRSPSVQ